MESSSLSSVAPPDINYRLQLPEEVLERGCISALQLEAVVYACQRHECILPNGQRAGFLVGAWAARSIFRIYCHIFELNLPTHRLFGCSIKLVISRTNFVSVF